MPGQAPGCTRRNCVSPKRSYKLHLWIRCSVGLTRREAARSCSAATAASVNVFLANNGKGAGNPPTARSMRPIPSSGRKTVRQSGWAHGKHSTFIRRSSAPSGRSSGETFGATRPPRCRFVADVWPRSSKSSVILQLKTETARLPFSCHQGLAPVVTQAGIDSMERSVGASANQSDSIRCRCTTWRTPRHSSRQRGNGRRKEESGISASRITKQALSPRSRQVLAREKLDSRSDQLIRSMETRSRGQNFTAGAGPGRSRDSESIRLAPAIWCSSRARKAVARFRGGIGTALLGRNFF